MASDRLKQQTEAIRDEMLELALRKLKQISSYVSEETKSTLDIIDRVTGFNPAPNGNPHADKPAPRKRNAQETESNLGRGPLLHTARNGATFRDPEFQQTDEAEDDDSALDLSEIEDSENYDVREAASVLGCTQQTIRVKARKGLLEHTKEGKGGRGNGQFRFTGAALKRYLSEKQKRSS